MTTGAIRREKLLQSNRHHCQTNTQLSEADCSSCRPTNSVTALMGDGVTLSGLALPHRCKKTFQKKIKNVKRRKKVTKIKNVCKRRIKNVDVFQPTFRHFV